MQAHWKTHYLSSNFRGRFLAKNRNHTNRAAMSAKSVFQVVHGKKRQETDAIKLQTYSGAVACAIISFKRRQGDFVVYLALGPH